MDKRRSRTRRNAVGLVVLLGLLPATAGRDRAEASTTTGTMVPPVAIADDAPTPTPARPGRPTKVGAVGDSITQATGTGALSAENPKNSWATGWEVNSVAARLAIPTGSRFNVSENGTRMADFAGQVTTGKSGGSGDVAAFPADIGLVLVEFGGNDLCRDDVSQMTPVATYRSQFQAGLAALKTRAPNALVQVMSVPDIYNLWYIRGAPQHATYHPEPESDQANGLNGARFYWSQSFFPCGSLLSNPDSYSQADRDRRAAVRERNKAYNQVLATECAKVLRCRFDDHALFDLTSNRHTPPDGPLKPKSQWDFVDADISRNEGIGEYICPVQGVFAGGCGDHFHPSKQGQNKVAQLVWEVGRDWTDATMPTASVTFTGTARPGGAFASSATAHFAGADPAGLRGQEVRVHRPDGSVSAWTEHAGVAPDLTVNDLGTSYVEVRSLDVNGNLSASVVSPVTVVAPAPPAAPGVPVVDADADGMTLSWSASLDDGGAPITSHDLTVYLDGSDTPSGPPIEVDGGELSLAVAPPAGHVVAYSAAARNAAGASPASDPSESTVAPFADLDGFVRRQYQDLAGRDPSVTERDAAVAALTHGSISPGALVEDLRNTAWWDGALGSTIRLYRAYFLRLPDPSGFDYWVGKRRSGYSLTKISQTFATSSEFVRTYGDLDDTEFIDAIYRNVFDRDPDPSGRAYYLGRLAAGWNRGRVVLQFSDSSEYRRNTDDLVAAVEIARGLNGRAPGQALVDQLVAAGGDAETAGRTRADGIVGAILGTESYRRRVHP